MEFRRESMLRTSKPTAKLFSDLRTPVPALGLAVFAVCAPMPVDAGSATGTATVTVGTEGSVGEVQTPTTTTTTAATTANDVSTTNGGGAKTPEAAVTQAGVTTFRPLPTITAPATDTGADGGDTGDSTETSSTGGGDGGGQGAAATGPRLPRGARPVGNLLGGVSSVSVSGSPNQAYGISLPGTTVINQGAQTTVIEGFVHNAGDTPTVSPSGQGSFSVGAQVSGDGEGGDPAAAGGEGAAATNNDGPVIISDPFMDVIIQYN